MDELTFLRKWWVNLHAAMEGWRSLDHPGGGWISHSDASLKKELSSELASWPLHTELTHLVMEWNILPDQKAIFSFFFFLLFFTTGRLLWSMNGDKQKKKLISSSCLCSPFLCLLEICLCGLSSDQKVTDDFWLGDGGVVVQEIEGSQWLLKSWKSNISSDFIIKN
jgi:hypothetical protein